MLKPKKFLILAHTRTGGTFLNHCLDSHPMIFCARGEPLFKKSWVSKLASVKQKLNVLLNLEGYAATGAKITYGQINHKVWNYIKENDVKVIHHKRGNILKSAISNMMRHARKEGKTKYPTHTLKEVKHVAPIEINVKDLMGKLDYHYNTSIRILDKLNRFGVKHIETTYYAQTEGLNSAFMKKEEAKRLCGFLKVEYRPLECPLKKINKFEFSDLIINWPAGHKAIVKSKYKYCLEENCI